MGETAGFDLGEVWALDGVADAGPPGLLCATRNERTVRYALARSTTPMAVAGCRYNELPLAEQAALPGEAEIVDAVTAALHRLDPEPGDS